MQIAINNGENLCMSANAWHYAFVSYLMQRGKRKKKKRKKEEDEKA